MTCVHECSCLGLVLFRMFVHAGYQHRVPVFMHPMWLPRRCARDEELAADGNVTEQPGETRRPGITAGVLALCTFYTHR